MASYAMRAAQWVAENPEKAGAAAEAAYEAGRRGYNAFRKGRASRGARSRSAPKRKSRKGKAKGVKFTGSLSGGSGQTMRMGKSKRKPRPKVPLKKRVAKLEKKTKSAYAKYDYKLTETLQVSSVANRCNYGSADLVTSAVIETMLSGLPYHNPATPSTTQQQQAQLIVRPTKWPIELYAHVTMRNNYLYPVRIRCYVLQPKVDSSTTPTTCVTNGITTKAVSVTSTTGPYLYPSDSKQFTDNWKILKSCDMKLQSGDECTVSHSEKFIYDQEFYDTNTSLYSKKYARLFFIRVVGVVCHDNTTTSLLGLAPTKVDALVHRKFTVSYPTEAPIQSMYDSTVLDTITTAVVGVSSAEVEISL